MGGVLQRVGAAALLFGACLWLGGCVSGRQPVTAQETAGAYTVSAGLANLLACPSLTCDVEADLRSGDRVVVLTVVPGGEWVEVRDLATGKRGFLLARFLARP